MTRRARGPAHVVWLNEPSPQALGRALAAAILEERKYDQAAATTAAFFAPRDGTNSPVSELLAEQHAGCPGLAPSLGARNRPGWAQLG